MKRKLQLAIPWLMALLLLVSFNSWGQGTENFEGSSLPSSYSDGTFVGANGITWTYVHARNVDTYPISGEGIMLRRADEPSSLSATIPGGIGNFSVDTRKAYTGNTQRKLELVINGNVIAQHEPVFADGADATVVPFIVNDINISGDVSLTLRMYGATGNQQIILDNISWTAPGAITQVATPTISPNGGTFYAPNEVTISTLTEDASIYYTMDGTDPDATSTLYTAPFTVSETTTVKAIGIKAGLDNSSIASATFTFPAVTDVATIADLRAGLTDGTAYRLTGEALITAMDGFNNRKFIQDATGAIMIFDNPGIIETDYMIGDKIQNIAGTLSLANNMLRFVPVADPGAAVSTGNAVVPTVFTIDALTTGDQAKLVTLKNVSFTSTGTFANGQNYTISDGTNTLVLRTDFWNVDYIGTEIPSTLHNITGVIIQFNATLQIVPRNQADLYEIPYSTHFQFAAVDATLPEWFGADTERGMAAGGGNLYAVSRKAGNFVRVFDPVTGLETGTLNTTGVSGGTFALNDAEVSGDGVVLAANMAMNTAVDGTAVFKVYEMDATDAPVPVIEYALPGIARLGDKFTLVGNFNDGSATLYAADGSNPRIFKFTLTEGVFGAPEIIPIAVPQGSTPAIAPLPDGSFYYNANGQSLSKLNADGTLIGTVPGGIISTGSNSIKYLGTDGGDEMVAVFNYGVGQERIKVIRVPAGDPTLATLEFETPSMRGNANANGSGDVAFIPGLDGSVHLYILSTNNGFAGYETISLDLIFPDYTGGQPVVSATVTPDEFEMFLNWTSVNPVLTITWNDASEITGMSFFDPDAQQWIALPDNMWEISNDDGTTANVTILLENSPAKNGKEGSIPWGQAEARIEFDLGDPAPITAIQNIKTFDLTFIVEDAAEVPITDAIISLTPVDGGGNVVGFEGQVYEVFASADYEYLVQKDGYQDATGTITNVGADQNVEVTLLAAAEDITTFPYHQNFNDVLFPPTGYQNLAVVGSGTWTRVTSGTNPTTSPQDGAGMIRYNCYSQSSGNTTALITPKVVIPAGDYQVRFSMYRDGGYPTTADRVEVLVNDTPDLTDAVSLGVVNRSMTLAPVVESAGWYYYAFPFPVEKAGDYYVIFKAISGYGNNIFVDAFYLEEVPTAPQLAVVPTSLDFGMVLEGTTSAPANLTLTNVAIGTLQINDGDITITGSDAALFSLGAVTYPIELDPSESIDIPLSFSPAVAGDYSATLNIVHNGSNSPTTVNINGSGYAPLAAFIEDFDLAMVGGLPSAWARIVQSSSSSAAVEVTTSGTPVSAPNQIRMANSNDTGANLFLITPAVTNFSANRIGFMARGTDYVLEVGTITDPSDPSTFTLLESVTLTSTVAQYYVNFDSYAGTDQYIAFKHGLGGTYRTIYMDDVVWEPIPSDPVFAISPESKDFGMLQIGQTSNPQTFTISNTGAGTLVINPTDITLTGTDAASFVLTTLAETAELAFGESASFTVAFAPQTVGVKSATIEINDNLSGKVINQIPITGEGFDATLYPTFIVDFNGETFPPLGWGRFIGLLEETTTLEATTSGWSHHIFGNQTSGTNNSAYINVYGSKNHWLISPPIVLGDGTTNYQLSFDIALTPWTGTAQSTLGPDDYLAALISTDNGETWSISNVLIDWDATDIISPTGNHIVVSLEGYTGTVKVAFYAERPSGSTPDLRFYVDNVSVEEAAEVPVFTINPETKDFGDVGVTEQSQPQTFIISNSGPGTLSVNAPALDNTTDYILNFDAEDFPAELTGTETVTFNVIFAPQTEGIHTGDVTINYGEGGTETSIVNLTGNGVIRPAGSTCANPYVFETLPVVDYADNTEAYGNDYGSTWINPNNSYLNGYDFVGQFTLDEPGYLSGSVTGSWTGLFILEECPDPDVPAAVLVQGTGSTGGSFNNVWMEAGTYFAIVSTWPSPDYTDFTLNLSFMTGYTVTFEVQDEDEAPITDAVVTLGDVTNEPGDYVFENLVPGTYAYTVVKDGYVDGAGDVEVIDADVTQTVTLVLIPLNPVIVSITPVADVEVEFGTVLDDAIAALAPTTTITDSDEGTHTVTLTWTIADYDGNLAGDYTATGTFNLPEGVDQADPAIPLEVSAVVTVLEEPIETFAVTFNVNMTYAEGFDPETDVVYITGDLLGWAAPGDDPDNQTMSRVDDSMIWTKTLELEAGSYEYKYFLNAGWDGGEWDGGDNRGLVVEGDMEVNDWFGYLTDPTSITDPSLADIRIFPVPARTMLTITSPEMIREVRMIDMLGQVVYNQNVTGLEHQLNVGEYKNGIYFLQILTDKGIETRRIQVQK